MAAFNIHLYEDTHELVELYNRNIAFKNSFQRLLERGGVTYRGRPLKTYVKLIVFVDPQYNKYLQSSFDVSGMDELFDHFYNKNTVSFSKLEKSIKTQTPLMPLENEEEIATIEALPDGEEKQKKWQEHEEKKEQTHAIRDTFAAPNKVPEHVSQVKPPLLPDKPLVGFLDLDHFTKKVQQRDQEEVQEQVEEYVQEAPSGGGQVSIPDEPETPSNEPTGSEEPTSRQPGGRGGGGNNRLAQELENRAARGLTNAGRAAGNNLARGAGRLAVQGAARAGALALAGAGGGGAALVVVGVILIAIFIAIFLPMFQQQQKDEALLMNGVALAATTSTGGNCPSQEEITKNKDPNTCHYFGLGVNIFDTNISQIALDGYINRYSSTFVGGGVGDEEEFIRRVNLIVSKAKSVGLNPAIFLGYWKTESLFGTYKNAATFGCAPGQNVKSFEIELNCALGLNPEGTGPGGALAARCAKQINPPSECRTLKITTFDEFAESYGSKSVDINNCTHTYNTLVEVAKELNVCKVTTPSSGYIPDGGKGMVGCPVNGGRMTFGSKDNNGHCHPSYYKFYCTPPGAPGYTGRDTAIDVQGSSRNVYLPNIGGGGVTWTISESGTSIATGEGGGIAVSAFADYNNHRYQIRFVHLESTNLRFGQRPPSGTLVGEYNFNANHLHVTIQEDGVYKPADLYFNLCQ